MSSLSIVDGDFLYEMRNAWKTPGTRQVQSCSAVREAQTLIEKNVKLYDFIVYLGQDVQQIHTFKETTKR